MDLRSVITSLGAPLVIRRCAVGIYSDGVYVAPTPTTLTVQASVQPAGANAKPRPEGIRVEDTKVVFSNTLLRVAQDPDGFVADRFDYEGLEFEVYDVQNWATGGQGLYYRCMAARVRTSEP